MSRYRDDMSSPGWTLLLVLLSFAATCNAGPVGPLPNVTSTELGLKEGTCSQGDVVYLPGDEFPGSDPCEKCVCRATGVVCEKQQCESRPGCKALHRPDHCCPTYQCECEQEGRVYGNGEKLVDPQDPCRVCYCQGGEVVCRRIACFVRDDCRPRRVPGRCCPEYDHCPLRGVTTLPGSGLSSPVPTISAEVIENPPPPKENKQQITIKEITPVSEIPVITEVKIKEILPSPSEVAEYSSSKSPLITREATTEKNMKEDMRTEAPTVVEVHSSSPETVSSPDATNVDTQNKETDATPSKISLSTQDSINSEIYPSNDPTVGTTGAPPVTPEPMPVLTTKAPIVEEEDTFDHNPAFPPLPDDLSVLRNHEDEIVPEPVVDNEHVPSHEVVVASMSTSTEAETKALLTTTPKDLADTVTATEMPKTTTEVPTTEKPKTTVEVTTTEKPKTTTEVTTTEKPETASEVTTTEKPKTGTEVTTTEKPQSATEVTTTENPTKITEITTTEKPKPITETSTAKPEEASSAQSTVKESPMLNLRSAIPTEILNAPSAPEEIAAVNETTTISSEITSTTTSTSTEAPKNVENVTTEKVEPPVEKDSTGSTIKSTTSIAPEIATTTPKPVATEFVTSSTEQELSTISITKSNVATEVTSQTELSSLPIETSDQNPPNILAKDEVSPSTVDTLATSSKMSSPNSEVITVSKSMPGETTGLDNIETTEFILTPSGSAETTTDDVELIKISAEPEKSAAIIEPTNINHNDPLTDLIKLVKDVASISNNTGDAEIPPPVSTGSTSISESEELIPVNAGYKSKNKNFNQNSITEIPIKSKQPVNKQKVVEIEDDESEGVTDSPPPNDKVEPTTRRPIIDNVSADNMTGNKTDKKDIEIITQSYVPTINRRPTKVILKEDDKSISEELPMEDAPVAASAESITESSASIELAQTTDGDVSSPVEIDSGSTVEIANATLSSTK